MYICKFGRGVAEGLLLGDSTIQRVGFHNLRYSNKGLSGKLVHELRTVVSSVLRRVTPEVLSGVRCRSCASEGLCDVTSEVGREHATTTEVCAVCTRTAILCRVVPRTRVLISERSGSCEGSVASVGGRICSGTTEWLIV